MLHAAQEELEVLLGVDGRHFVGSMTESEVILSVGKQGHQLDCHCLRDWDVLVEEGGGDEEGEGKERDQGRPVPGFRSVAEKKQGKEKGAKEQSGSEGKKYLGV